MNYFGALSFGVHRGRRGAGHIVAYCSHWGKTPVAPLHMPLHLCLQHGMANNQFEIMTASVCVCLSIAVSSRMPKMIVHFSPVYLIR